MGTFWQTSQNKKHKKSRGWTGDIGLTFLRGGFCALVGLNFMLFSWCVYCSQKKWICYCLHITILTKTCVSTIWIPLHPPWLPLLFVLSCCYRKICRFLPCRNKIVPFWRENNVTITNNCCFVVAVSTIHVWMYVYIALDVEIKVWQSCGCSRAGNPSGQQRL